MGNWMSRLPFDGDGSSVKSRSRQKSRRHDEEAADREFSLPPTPAGLRGKRSRDDTSERTRVLNLPKDLRHENRRNLIYRIEYGPRHYANVVNLAELNRLNLHYLRRSLAEMAININKTFKLEDGDAKRLTEELHAYCEAVRDWDLMEEKWNSDWAKDPFKLISSRRRDACLMEDYDIEAAVTQRDQRNFDTFTLASPVDKNEPELPGTSRAWVRKSKDARALTERTWFGLLGGLALIGPMLIMVLHKDLLTTLLTVSIATLLFAVFIARFTDISPKELMGATAAYAAVLVVFVGTSTS